MSPRPNRMLRFRHHLRKKVHLLPVQHRSGDVTPSWLSEDAGGSVYSLDFDLTVEYTSLDDDII